MLMNESEYTFHIENIEAMEAIFIGEICKLFCDPAMEENLRLFKRGLAAIKYDGRTGRMLFQPSPNPLQDELDGTFKN